MTPNPYRENGIPTMEYRFVNVSTGSEADMKLNYKVNELAAEGFRFRDMTGNEHRFIVCMERLKPV